MKTYLQLLLILSFQVTWAGEHRVTEMIHFQVDKFDLDQKEIENLNSFLEQIDLSDDYIIMLSGHTDNDGSLTYNDQLSERRVNSVREFLISKGVDPQYIDFSYHGERRPLEPNKSSDKKRRNRRVEVIYSTYYFENEKELLDSISFGYQQTFLIDPSTEHALITNNGVRINIPAHCFSTTTKQISLTVKEGIDYSSFIAHELNTVSANRMIESGGMIHLDARDSDGNEVALADEMFIDIEIPAESVKSDMQLFVSNEGRDWIASGPLSEEPNEIIENNTGNRLIPIPPFVAKHHYVDKSTMPVKPAKPAMPRDPHMPKPESYEPAKTFWNWVFKNRAEERANERYLEAMDEYHIKVGKFEESMANYFLKKERYIDRIEEYKKEYNLWVKEQERLARIYYREQLKAYNQRYAEEIKANELIAAKFRQEREEQRQKALSTKALELDLSANAKLDEGRSYAMKVLRLGWFNIDRFLEVINDPVLAVWDNDESEESVQLIFPDRRGIVNLNKEDDAYRLKTAIPANERMVVFAFKVKHGRPYVYVHELREGEENLELEFKRCRFTELKGILEDIGKTRTASL